MYTDVYLVSFARKFVKITFWSVHDDSVDWFDAA